MNLEELLKSNRPPKKDEITDEDLARLFMKYRGLLKQWERDKAFSAATHENIRIASAKLDELVEERTAELRKTNEQLQQAEAKLQHLNLVLRAIRSINQLIIQEKDRDRLLKDTCATLIETRGYDSTCICLFDESGMLVAHAEAGLGKDFLPMVERLKRGELSDCIKRTLIQSGVVITKVSSLTCGDCPLVEMYSGKTVITVRIEHGGKVYGLLRLSLSGDASISGEEQSLLQEITGDIAFGLHDMELEEERKQAERATQEAREYAEGIAGTVREPLVVLDADLKVISANRAFYQTFKTTSEESEGRLIYELGDRQWDIPRLRELLEQILPQNTRFDDFEVEHDFPAIGRRAMLLNARRIYREANKTQMILLAIEDITERKQAEEELSRLYKELKTLNLELEKKVKERTSQLEEAVQTADVASRAKSDFLASMSHELRTPLNAVIGFSQVLQEQYFGKLNEKQAEYVTDILESGQHLLSLINDILDLAKIEAGKMELELSKVIIKDLLGSSLTMIKEKALVHGISLDIDTTGDLEYLEIMVDVRRVKQVMFNLLSNAAKFTPDGGAIRVEGKKEGKELIISVSDTGIGITPEEQERVFEEFYQTSNTIKDKTPGTGLGLPVTKSIVEMHGGRIWVESEGSGKGSRFIFTLPI